MLTYKCRIKLSMECLHTCKLCRILCEASNDVGLHDSDIGNGEITTEQVRFGGNEDGEMDVWSDTF